MAYVLGPRSWIFWWAGLTATVFLQDWIRRLAGFFRDNSIFSPAIPPFNFVAAANMSIDSMAEYLRLTVRFNPGMVLASIGPVLILNWMAAAILGIVILLLAAVLYLRALGTSNILDDFVALIALYFVIRIESHLASIANFPLLSSAGQSLLSNPLLILAVLIILVFVLALSGEGLHSPRSFWRAVLEGLLVAILLFPNQAGQAVSAGLELFATFGRLVQANLTFGVVWGLVGMVLAMRRLYYVDAHA